MTKRAAGVVMDSKKLLGAFNSSAQAKIATLTEAIHHLGRSKKRDWHLAAVTGDQLFVECRTTGRLYAGSFKREKGGKLTITAMRPIVVVESKKRHTIEASCLRLIDSIEANHQAGMSTSFNQLANARFTPRTIPESGVVKTRDGVVRTVVVAESGPLTRTEQATLAKFAYRAFTKAPGQMTFSEETGDVNQTIPLSDWAYRRCRARHMRQVALEAYKSEGFQNCVMEVARAVYDGKVDAAVDKAKPFLREFQEFCVLDRRGLQRLIENALATRGCFNQTLCDDVATLFWRTNLNVNRNDILTEWRNVAKVTGNANLLDNISRLEQSGDFEAAYNKLIGLIFTEAVSSRDVTADAYLLALKKVRDVPRVDEEISLAEKIDDLIARLSKPEPDHATIAEAEDTLAAIKDELKERERGQDIDNFDDVKGDLDGGDIGDDVDLSEPEKPAGGTTVNFNINIGKDGDVSTDGDEDLAGMDDVFGGDEEGGEEEGGGLDDMIKLGGGGGEEEDEEEGGGGLDLGLESLQDDQDAMTEADPYYRYRGTSNNSTKPFGHDYGRSPITVAEDRDRVVAEMLRIVVERKLSAKTTTEQFGRIAKLALEAVGMRIPERAIGETLDQLNKSFWVAAKQRGLQEGQFKNPTKRRRSGFQKNNLTGGKKNIGESINWLKHQRDGALGVLNNTRFILDHGDDFGADPVVMSEDATVSLDVPPHLHESAYAAAGAVGDPKPFVAWLRGNLSKLHVDGELLDEAVARITAGADGSLNIEVDGVNGDGSTPPVTFTGPGGGAPGGAPGPEMGAPPSAVATDPDTMDDFSNEIEMEPMNGPEVDAPPPMGGADDLGADAGAMDFEGPPAGDDDAGGEAAGADFGAGDEAATGDSDESAGEAVDDGGDTDDDGEEDVAEESTAPGSSAYKKHVSDGRVAKGDKKAKEDKTMKSQGKPKSIKPTIK